MEVAISVFIFGHGGYGTCPSLLVSVEEPPAGWHSGAYVSSSSRSSLEEASSEAKDVKTAILEDLAKCKEEKSQRRNTSVVARYLINCGEGSQRLCAQFQLKSAKVRSILCTRMCATHCGGLAGLNFALSDAGSPHLDIRGLDGIDKLVESFKQFIPRTWPEVSVKPLESTSCHKAKFEQLGLVQVLTVTIKASSRPEVCPLDSYCHWCHVDKQQATSEEESSSASSSEDEDDESEEDESEEDESDEGDENAESDENVEKALCYILRAWSKVQYDRKAPVEESPWVLIGVVDCPSKAFIPSLTSSIHFRKKACEHRLKVIFHLGEQDVVTDPQYESWMETLQDTVHVFAHWTAGGDPIAADPFPSSARWAACLHRASPDTFPKSHVTSLLETHGAAPDEALEQYLVQSGQTLQVLQGGQRFPTQGSLMLRMEFPSSPSGEPFACVANTDYWTVPWLQNLRLEQCVQSCEAKLELHQDALDPNELDIDMVEEEEEEEEEESVQEPRSAKRAKVASLSCMSTRSVDAPEPWVAFLGTGSAKPAKLRGCSAILVKFSGVDGEFALLDAGEGTYTQMLRMFGEVAVNYILGKLAWVWISHHHLDHHGGVGRLLEVCADHPSRQSKLLLIGPTSMAGSFGKYLASMGRFKDPLNMFRFFPCHQVQGCIPGAKASRVIHCHDAFALGFPLPLVDGSFLWLVYSGDTRPCPRMWKQLSKPAGCKYAVLIHEATFADSMQEKAERRRHSTTGEALQAAEALGADVLFLTHFSQRFPKLSVTGETVGTGKCFIASDLMLVRLIDDLNELWRTADSLTKAVLGLVEEQETVEEEAV